MNVLSMHKNVKNRDWMSVPIYVLRALLPATKCLRKKRQAMKYCSNVPMLAKPALQNAKYTLTSIVWIVQKYAANAKLNAGTLLS
jgi:hypothetical protein